MKMSVWRDSDGFTHMARQVAYYPLDEDIIDMVTIELSEEFVTNFNKARDEWQVMQNKLYNRHCAKVAGEVCSVCDAVNFADIFFTKNGPVFRCEKHLPSEEYPL